MKMRRSTFGSSVWGNPREFGEIDQIARKQIFRLKALIKKRSFLWTILRMEGACEDWNDNFCLVFVCCCKECKACTLHYKQLIASCSRLLLLYSKVDNVELAYDWNDNFCLVLACCVVVLQSWQTDQAGNLSKHKPGLLGPRLLSNTNNTNKPNRGDPE